MHSSGVVTAADGTVLGLITSGFCVVGESGRMHCESRYAIPARAVVDAFRLDGRFITQADEVHGSGDYLAGSDPPYQLYSSGAWQADRIDP